jgi:hypothetical protein
MHHVEMITPWPPQGRGRTSIQKPDKLLTRVGAVCCMNLSRRSLIAVAGSVAAAALLRSQEAAAAPAPASALLERALTALDRHDIPHRDTVAIADFSLPSSAPRFHLIDIAGGGVRSYLVAHGRGSDPAHTGWLHRFSNELRSMATSAGAFRTEDIYFGAHGRSIRLTGLDATNDNALSRAIVVHAAWYVSPEMIRANGVLGRSEGCFALADTNLAEVSARLGPGRLIYADKI